MMEVNSAMEPTRSRSTKGRRAKAARQTLVETAEEVVKGWEEEEKQPGVSTRQCQQRIRLGSKDEDHR